MTEMFGAKNLTLLLPNLLGLALLCYRTRRPAFLGHP